MTEDGGQWERECFNAETREAQSGERGGVVNGLIASP